MDRAGKIRLLKELGIDHRVRVSAGTWDVIEPNLLIEIPGDDMQKATLAGALLADGLGQDAFVTVRYTPEGDMLGYKYQLDRNLSAKDLETIRNAVNPTGDRQGYQFSKSPDGKSVRFLYFGPEAQEEEWFQELSRRFKETGLEYKTFTFKQQGGLYEAGEYRRIFEENGDTYGTSGRSDLQGRVSDLVRTFYVQEVLRRGWEFDPLQYARSRGWSDAEAREILGDFFPPETHSYQIKEVLERLDPTLDQGSRMAPIRGLPQKISESILRFIEHVHPGARPFFARYSPLPGQLAEQMVMTWERLVKNFSGRSTAESAEIIKRRELARYMQKAERIVYTHYVNALRWGHGEGPSFTPSARPASPWG